MHRFRDRSEAGRTLAAQLRPLAGRDDLVVLGLPRGGVPVAAEVAVALGAPLDVLVVRKIGVPGREELALGAIAGGGIRVVNEDVRRHFGISGAALDRLTARQAVELSRREEAYRGAEPWPELTGRVVVLVDDGLATGASMRSAIEAVRTRGPARVVVAVPVAPPDTCCALESMGVEVIAVFTPDEFWGVGRFYEDFTQTTDEEVRELLMAARQRVTESR